MFFLYSFSTEKAKGVDELPLRLIVDTDGWLEFFNLGNFKMRSIKLRAVLIPAHKGRRPLLGVL